MSSNVNQISITTFDGDVLGTQNHEEAGYRISDMEGETWIEEFFEGREESNQFASVLDAINTAKLIASQAVGLAYEWNDVTDVTLSVDLIIEKTGYGIENVDHDYEPLKTVTATYRAMDVKLEDPKEDKLAA